MSILPMAFNPDGVPKHILIGSLLEALTECSAENSIAKHVHQPASALVALHIDSEGRSTIKTENNPSPPKITLPPRTTTQSSKIGQNQKRRDGSSLKNRHDLPEQHRAP
jgi:hypothetical protein